MEQPSNPSAAEEEVPPPESETAQQEQQRKETPAVLDGVELERAEPSAPQLQRLSTDLTEERAKAGLGAQQDTALWTFWLVVATAASVVVAFVAVVLVYCTFRETRQTNQRQLRAYMSLAPASVSFRGHRLIVNIAQKNNGQTPALSVKLSQHIEVLPYPLPEDHQFPATTDCPGTNVVHPDHQFSVAVESDIHAGDYWKAPEDENATRVYVFAVLSYVDVFKQPRTTRACWSYKNAALHSADEELTKARHTINNEKESVSVSFEYAEKDGYNTVG